MNRCTCGPHPRIDLTAAYLEYHLNNSSNRESDDAVVTTSDAFKTSNKTSSSSSSCREEIQQACVSHGCFHISIDLSPPINESYNVHDDSGDNTLLPIRCLAKPIAEVENDIESLFSSSSSNTVLDHHDMNGGAVKVCIKNHQCKNIEPLSAFATTTTTRLVEEATFRGRTAESGDEQQLIPEPKLSWEYCRCIAARLTTAGTASAAATDDDDDDDDTSGKSENKNNLHHHHLQNWTQALHSVASVVIHSLGIPPQVMLHEEKCNCLHKILGSDHMSKNLSPDNNNNNENKNKCNVDLLRCFRYDAISATDNDNDDKEEAEQSLLGSSAHTDWGSLTVVWQDEKGGLQTYCHACEKWSDVDATQASSDDTNNDSKNNAINLFVHVGDFLSLATAGDGRIQRQHSPIWPSPRHRVICPTLQQQSSDQRSERSSNSSNCRRSLVYFAYPPPNISLSTAQAVVEPLLACKNDDFCKISSDKFQDYYSLLQDQSQHQPGDSLKLKKENNLIEAYENIRRRPFGQVIADKWNQVQRK